MTIQTIACVDIEEITKHFHTPMQGYEFTQMAENGSYRPVFCDDGTLEELWEEYEWYKEKEPVYAFRLWNQAKLIEYFRKLGYRGEVLVYVHW